MDWVTIISSVGFPIVACGAMAWAFYNTLTEIRLTIEQLKGIIERNTDALNDISHIIKGGNDDGK